MTRLEVPGARLSYEVRGAGPVMVMISGASGAGAGFTEIADLLSDQFTVVTYDRRGFSQSELTGAQDRDHRLETDVNDVFRVIQHFGHGGSTVVYGASSGAIIVLELIATHPERIRCVIAHEPPLMMLLSEGRKWIEFFRTLYGVYRESGPEAALDQFYGRVFPESDARTVAHMPKSEQAKRNSIYWFELELRQYPAVPPPVHALKPQSERVVLTAGRKSKGHPAGEATFELGKLIDRSVLELPGGHLGPLSSPAEYAARLIQAVQELGS